MKNVSKNSPKSLQKNIRTMPTAKIFPLGSRVLVEPEEKLTKEKTDLGIYIPESSDKERPEQGRVIALGEGSWVEGKLVPVSVKIGDKVIFSKYGYDEIKIDEKKYFLIKEENILAIIK